jgi:hypothetical protein
VPVIGIVTIGMMQADINAEVDPVILRVPPTGIDDLVCVRRGVHGTIRNAIVYAVVTIVIDPIAEAVRPVSARAGVANACLWRRRTRRRRRRTVLAGGISGVSENDIVVGIVRRGMIEDGFLRGAPRIRRIEKWRDRSLKRERRLHRGAAHTEEKTAKQESRQCILK